MNWNMESTILWMLAALLLFSLCTCRDNPQKPNSILKLDENLIISWTIDTVKKTIRFKVKAAIHKTGWFVIGFEPQKGKPPKDVTEIRGDAFVVWRQIVNSGQNKTLAWTVTDCNTFHNGTFQRDKKQNYHLPKNPKKTMYKNKTLTAIVWRKLDTEDEEDVIIKKGSMFIFGSYGNEDASRKWKNRLPKIKNGLEDVFRKASVVSFYSSKREKGGKNFGTYAGKLAEQHWIGLVVGMSAFLTILITCTVYCLAKKVGGFKKKHVSMSFHKETEYDDEAKVAFLQSEET